MDRKEYDRKYRETHQKEIIEYRIKNRDKRKEKGIRENQR